MPQYQYAQTSRSRQRESDERLKVVMDNIPQAIFWKDRNLAYQGCNRQFAQDGGLSSPDEIIGKTALDMPWAGHAAFYHSDDLEVMESETSPSSTSKSRSYQS
jgi:PAS domain-containing protein